MVRNLIAKGLELHRAGRLSESKGFYEQALAIQPRHPDALHLSGILALQCGDPERAVELIQRAIAVQPGNPAFHANLGQAFLAAHRVDAANAAFRRAGRLDPRNPQHTVAAASCLAIQGDLPEAEAQLRKVTRDHPGYALAWLNLGNAVLAQGRPEEALGVCLRAADLEPASVDAQGSVGKALHALSRFEEAEIAYRRCVALQPESEPGYRNLASVLMDCGKFDHAVIACEQGIARAPVSAELHMMLGSAYVHQGKLTAALEVFRNATNLAPDNLRALWAYGSALRGTGAVAQGMELRERVLALQPDSPEFRYGASCADLSLGNLQAGWMGYEWRSSRQTFPAQNPGIRLATELPASLQGKKVSLLREQGLGDELFFLRFTAELKSRGAEITYQADKKLAPLLGRVPALDRVTTGEIPRTTEGLCALLGDLPKLLGASNFQPPLALTPLPHRLQEIKGRLAELGPRPYLGLTWRAGIAPQEQRGTAWALHKSVPLDQLGAALRDVSGTLLTLQRAPREGEIGRLASIAGKPVHDLSALNEDLEGMLALLAVLDEYIGVSNTNMHLRAGSGRSARVLVPCPPEWRWMISGDESPWFPGFRICRQRPDGDWSAALDQLTRDLQTELAKRLDT
jgi:tetratricopeptide (TPR) repeat protein